MELHIQHFKMGISNWWYITNCDMQELGHDWNIRKPYLREDGQFYQDTPKHFMSSQEALAFIERLPYSKDVVMVTINYIASP